MADPLADALQTKLDAGVQSIALLPRVRDPEGTIQRVTDLIRGAAAPLVAAGRVDEVRAAYEAAYVSEPTPTSPTWNELLASLTAGLGPPQLATPVPGAPAALPVGDAVAPDVAPVGPGAMHRSDIDSGAVSPSADPMVSGPGDGGARPVEPVAVDASAPPGWHPDPLGTHHHRYWDGAAWTGHVSDDGVASFDGLPAAAEPATTPTMAPDPTTATSVVTPPATTPKPVAPAQPTTAAPAVPAAPAASEGPTPSFSPGEPGAPAVTTPSSAITASPAPSFVSAPALPITGMPAPSFASTPGEPAPVAPPPRPAVPQAAPARLGYFARRKHDKKLGDFIGVASLRGGALVTRVPAEVVLDSASRVVKTQVEGRDATTVVLRVLYDGVTPGEEAVWVSAEARGDATHVVIRLEGVDADPSILNLNALGPVSRLMHAIDEIDPDWRPA